MTVYKSHLQEPWFSLIKSGKKIAEGRLNKGRFAIMKKGDIINFFNRDLDDNYFVKIVDIKYYKTFYDMIEGEKLENTLPHPKIKTIRQGVDEVYYKFYSPKDEKKYGIVAILLKKVNK